MAARLTLEPLAPAAAPPGLAIGDVLARRMVVVCGKGGVGKSTVAAALALAAAQRGRRALVVEVAGRHDVARALSSTAAARRARPYVEHRLAPGVSEVSVDARHALREYLGRALPPAAVGVLLAGSAFSLLMAATPGMAELLTIGKAWDVARTDRPRRGRRRHDLVILDAPATGHGVAMLRAPRTFAGVTATGPVAAQARAIDAFLHDPTATAVIAVTAPEELAVTETLELRDGLRDQAGLPLVHVVVDGMLPDRFTAAQARAVDAAAPSRGRRAARFAIARARLQRAELARLATGLGDVPVTLLPYVFAPALGPAELAALAGALAPSDLSAFPQPRSASPTDGGAPGSA